MNIRRFVSVWMWVSVCLLFVDVLTDSVIVNIIAGIAALSGFALFSLMIVYYARERG